MERGFLFVISGPSAVGKTSVVNEILKLDKNLSRIVTCTTRKMREGEIDGIDYYFLDKDTFLRYRENGDFAEMSEVYGNYYGVLLSKIKEAIDEGKNSILIINWEGYLKIKKEFKNRAIGFFLLPPSAEDLEKRIRNRGSDSEEAIKTRMSMIGNDLSHKNEFEYQIVNVEIEKTAKEILKLIKKFKSKQGANFL